MYPLTDMDTAHTPLPAATTVTASCASCATGRRHKGSTHGRTVGLDQDGAASASAASPFSASGADTRSTVTCDISRDRNRVRDDVNDSATIASRSSWNHGGIVMAAATTPTRSEKELS